MILLGMDYLDQCWLFYLPTHHRFFKKIWTLENIFLDFQSLFHHTSRIHKSFCCLDNFNAVCYSL